MTCKLSLKQLTPCRPDAPCESCDREIKLEGAFAKMQAEGGQTSLSLDQKEFLRRELL